MILTAKFFKVAERIGSQCINNKNWDINILITSMRKSRCKLKDQNHDKSNSFSINQKTIKK